MSRDALIEKLAANLAPVRPRRTARDFAILAAICAIEIALFFLTGQARPDMPDMMMQPSFWWRLASLGLIAGISATLAILSLNPVRAPGRALRWIFLITAACVAIGLCLNAGPAGLLALLPRLNPPAGLRCMEKMVILSIPPILALGLLMRRGAPTNPRATALLAGLAAAAWGAFVFVFACPSNDPLYIAVWYTLGCGCVTLAARIILPRLARW